MRAYVASLSVLILFSSGASVPAPARMANEKCRATEDSSSPTWGAIGRQYSKLARAMQRKDFGAMLALYLPNFEVQVPKNEAADQTGPKWTREQSLAYQKAGLERVKESRLISNTITRLKDCGDRATATVLQQWDRTQMMGGTLHNVETAAVQDEEWIRTPEGWKRGNIGNVHVGAWLVDGKRVDPSKGYQPDAPPYDPYPEAPAKGN